jgi:hypothetical protein
MVGALYSSLYRRIFSKSYVGWYAKKIVFGCFYIHFTRSMNIFKFCFLRFLKFIFVTVLYEKGFSRAIAKSAKNIKRTSCLGTLKICKCTSRVLITNGKRTNNCWRISSLNHQNLIFFSEVPWSPTNTVQAWTA